MSSAPSSTRALLKRPKTRACSRKVYETEILTFGVAAELPLGGDSGKKLTAVKIRQNFSTLPNVKIVACKVTPPLAILKAEAPCKTKEWRRARSFRVKEQGPGVSAKRVGGMGMDGE